MLGFLGLTMLAWLASACVAAVNLHGWYIQLASPDLTPRSAVIGQYWTAAALLYVAMALAAWLVWRRSLVVGRWRAAMICWGWQLAFGAAWPAVFFGLHLLLPALLLAVMLAASTALTAWRFRPLEAAASWLMLPFFGLTLFMTYLNAGFWWLNH